MFARRGLYNAAALAFERCTQEHPEIFEAHYDLALADFALHKYSEAFGALDTCHPSNSRQRIAWLYLRGKIENTLGRSRKAGRDLLAAFSADPSEEDYALDLGLYDLEHNAFPEAIRVFVEARKFHPHSVITGLGLALAQYLSGRAPECILTCKEFLSERPDFAPMRTLLAFSFYMEGNFRKAEEVARLGLHLSEPHPYLNYLDVAALLKLQSKDYSRMSSEISVAERQIAACGLCYVAQSKIDEAQGTNVAAIRDLQRAMQLQPTSPEAWYRLAVLYAVTGQRVQAAHAHMHFTALQAAKSEHETDMLRSAFMRALATSGHE
jgi:tetratricopeptide (TPR) repeat protein